MKNIPKKNIFTVPDGYFEQLPERIRRKKEKKTRQVWLSGAAAAVLVLLGFMMFIVSPNRQEDSDLQAKLLEDVELYINSGVWNEEDVLLLAEFPNDILEQIIAEEWDYGAWEEEYMDNEIWY
ncbi:hypothetical protein [Negadavirga shengliensis]|uniref:Uncharacterized protein n=1 Tax=Negadavirga shengliensis TaxID=1389218 RepID=A0ABV9T662_9BACT